MANYKLPRKNGRLSLFVSLNMTIKLDGGRCLSKLPWLCLVMPLGFAISASMVTRAQASLIVSNLQGETIQGAAYSGSPNFPPSTFTLPFGAFQAAPSSTSIGDGTKSAAASTAFFDDDLTTDGFTANGGASVSVQILGTSQTTAICAEDTVAVSMTFQVDQTEAYIISAGVTLNSTLDGGATTEGITSYVQLYLSGGGSLFAERNGNNSAVVTLYPDTTYVLGAAIQSEAEIPIAASLPASGLVSGSYNLSLIPPVFVTAGQTYHFAANGGTGILVETVPGVTVAATGFAILDPAANHANRQLLVIIGTGLSLAGSTGAWTGKLDLGNNDLDLPGGSLAVVTNQLAEGYASGTWNGVGGITSASAAVDSTHLTALGVIQNNQSGTALYTAANPFDGTTPGVGDILIKYTYYGDANVDGKVDGSDFSLIDTGYQHHLTGWFNGDFNYDGMVNGSDYTLIDNAFNQQGVQLTAAVATAEVAGATSSSVPEPAGLSLLSIGGIALLRRRRRRGNLARVNHRFAAVAD